MRTVDLAIFVLVASLSMASAVHAQGVSVESKVDDVVATVDNFVSDVVDGIKGLALGILSEIQDFALFVKDAIVDFSKVLAVILGVVGGFLWLSGLSPYRGRRLILSALLLALFSIVITSI